MPIANKKNYNQSFISKQFTNTPTQIVQIEFNGELLDCTIVVESTSYFFIVYTAPLFGSISDFSKSNYESIRLLSKHNKDPPIERNYLVL
jgi:hypothetical protein